MSGLGELLELLHGAHDRTRTLQAEFRDWERRPAGTGLVTELRGESPHFRWRAGGCPWPRAAEARRRLRLRHPDHLRVEVLRSGRLIRVGVRIEDRWWRWDHEQGAGSGEPAGVARPWLPPLLDPPLLCPVRLLSLLSLEPAGIGDRAGGAVLLADATLRSTPGAWAPLSFELEFDAEHGTMLRLAAFEGEQCVRLTEALTVRYNEPIGPDEFELTLPAEGRASQAP